MKEQDALLSICPLMPFSLFLNIADLDVGEKNMAKAKPAVTTNQLIAEENELIGEIEKRHGKSVDELRIEREQRVKDAIALREPDRVPVTLNPGVFAARAAGLPASAMFYDHGAARQAGRRILLDFEPDIGGIAMAANPGTVLDILDVKNYRWPGGPLAPDADYQFVEDEYMKPEEYDVFLNDPSDFILRYYLPRVTGILAPMTKLPPIGALRESGFTGFLGFLATPEFQHMADRINAAILEQTRITEEALQFTRHLERLGFPSMFGGGGAGGGVGGAPMDAIADLLRGMRGIMLDIYRCPDKLIEASERVLNTRIRNAAPADPNWKGIPQRGGGPLHRGSDEFMSIKHFEKFYWPGLRRSTQAGIDLGYIVAHFYEGVWDQRLEYLLEFPKGKLIFFCERTNIFRAKEVLGNRCCIQGGVPAALLTAGSPQDVDEYCKKLIKVVGKGGGFILGCGSSIDCARPANVKAMVDSVKKYRPD
jgi:hypothetical protein